MRDEAPHVSMVVFVTAEDFSEFYIHVSRLAQHTLDMQKDKHMSLLIAETDDGRADPQTLTRVIHSRFCRVYAKWRTWVCPYKELCTSNVSPNLNFVQYLQILVCGVSSQKARGLLLACKGI